MAYKDILVLVDGSRSSDQRLGAAVNVAEAHGASLTGVYVMQRSTVPAYAEAQIAADVLEMHAKALQEAADQAEAQFNEKLASSSADGTWRCVEGDPSDVAAHMGRRFDLVVLGQYDPDDDLFPSGRDMPDHVVLTCGRPVLMVPYNFHGGPIGERIMVAWDGSRTATRAVHDSVPFLAKAEEVVVMVVNPHEENVDSGEPAAQIAAHIANHGGNAKAAHVINRSVDPAELLLSQSADAGADMIVCGAYGHARWRELVLGGVTDHLLQHMPVPILMSH